MEITFTKDGQTRVATLPRQAVRLRFDGWSEVDTTAPPAIAEQQSDTGNSPEGQDDTSDPEVNEEVDGRHGTDANGEDRDPG